MRGPFIRIAVGLLLCVEANAIRPAVAIEVSHGRQVLLNRGLQLQTLTNTGPSAVSPNGFTSADVTQWQSANFTGIDLWNYADQDDPVYAQLPATQQWGKVWTGNTNSSYLLSGETPYKNNMTSIQYYDELGTLTNSATLSSIAATYASWNTLFPDALAYTNSYGGQYTTAQLASYMKATNPDMIMFDNYPSFAFNTSDRNSWYSTMQQYRTLGLAGNDGTGNSPIPYGQYLNLYRTSYSGSTPSESFVRLQEFASWAFGYTYATGFIYNETPGAGVYPVMFNSTGVSSPNTAVFNYVAETNRESQNLGPALVRLVSTDIRMIPGSGHSVSGTGITAWAPGANGGNDYLTSITPTVSQGGANSTSYSDVLIGYFKPLLANNSDYPLANGTHFMIVNGASQGTAAASAQWYHLTFNFGSTGFNSLEEISRDTGQILTIPLTHVIGSTYSLDINLPGGTGDLFQYSFVGGDLNGDGVVNLSDYSILMSHWLQNTNGTPSSGDLNGDGKVDLADFSLFKQAYQLANGGGSDLSPPVPEPGTLALSSGLAAWLLARVRRTRRRALPVMR